MAHLKRWDAQWTSRGRRGAWYYLVSSIRTNELHCQQLPAF